MAIKQDKENKGKDPSHIVSTINNWVEESRNDTGTWRSRQDKWYRLRQRVKKKKSLPFVGCSNLRLPTLDINIRKLKASIMQAVFGVRPVVQVEPTPSGSYEKAQAIEKFLDHLLMDVIKIKPTATIAVDQELEKGFYILKPFWNIEVVDRKIVVFLDSLDDAAQTVLFDPETPREALLQAFAARVEMDDSNLVVRENVQQINNIVDGFLAGEESVTIKLRDVIKNHPDVALVNPEKLYVPESSGYDPQSCQYIIQEFYIPYSQFCQNVNNKGWDRSSLDVIDYSKECDLDKVDVTRSQREGIDLLRKKDLIKIYECYCYWDINNDGKDEKVIITTAPDFDLELRTVELPFNNNKWPFVKLYYELTDDRWFSHRGLPELIEDLVKEIDTQHMQRIDSQTLRNQPQFLFRAGQFKGKSKNFGFARGIPVSGHQKLDDVIKPFNATNTNAEFSYKDEQQILEMKIAQLIGQVDFGLQSQINKRQPRSSQEVEFQVSDSQMTLSLDNDQHRQQFQELFEWIWSLWSQFGDDEYQFNYFGQEGMETIRMTREQDQGKYSIKVRANDNNTNPAVNQQKATIVLRDTYQAYQMGLASPEAVLQARKRAMQEIGIEDWQQFLQPPPPPQKPPTPVQPIIVDFNSLTTKERAQVLASVGVQPDVIGRTVEKQKDEDQQELENLLKVTEQIENGE